MKTKKDLSVADGSAAVQDRARHRHRIVKGKRWPRRAFLIFIGAGLAVSVAVAYFWSSGIAPPEIGETTDRLKSKGLSRYRAQKYERAIDYLKKYLAKKPRDWRIREIQSDAYWHTGSAGQAFAELKRAHDIDGPQADRLYKMGLLADSTDQEERAIKYLSWSVRLKPGSLLYRVELAKSYVKSKRYDEAVEQWQKAIEMLPDGDFYAAVIYAELGDTFQQKGEPEKAKDAYTRGLEIEPDNIYLKDQVTKVGGQ